MFGNLILKFRIKWKQFWCIHNYKYTYHSDYGQEGFDIYRCDKCGKQETDEGIWLGYTGPIKDGD